MVTIDGLSKDELGIVHATKYKPLIDEGGVLSIPTTYDVLGGLFQSPDSFLFRNTVHTSLNGIVASHMQGNWNDMQYVVVAPLNEVIEKNGPPAGFMTVDTYWAFDEEKPMRLGEYKLVQPREGNFDSDIFFEVEGKNIFYKTNFTDDNRFQFLQNFLPNNDPYKYEKGGRIRLYSQFSQNLKYQEISSIPHDFYVETEEDVERLEGIVLSASGEDKKIIDNEIIRHVRNSAVNHALGEYRCPLRTCGKDYWVDGCRTAGSDEFAEDLGTIFTKHYDSAQHGLESLINGTTAFGVTERASAENIREYIAGNRNELTDQSVNLVERIIDSDVYQQSRDVRRNILNSSSLLGHNGGSKLETV